MVSFPLPSILVVCALLVASGCNQREPIRPNYAPANDPSRPRLEVPLGTCAATSDKRTAASLPFDIEIPLNHPCVFTGKVRTAEPSLVLITFTSQRRGRTLTQSAALGGLTQESPGLWSFKCTVEGPANECDCEVVVKLNEQYLAVGKAIVRAEK